MIEEDADHLAVVAEEAGHVLVVDERESCRASFMPENTLLQIWREPERARREEKCDSSEFEDECEYVTPKPHNHAGGAKEAKRATQNPLFRRKVPEIAIAQEKKEEAHKEDVEDLCDNKEEISVKSDKRLLPNIDGIAQELIATPKFGSFGRFVSPAFKFIIRYCWVMPNVIISLFGNRLTWNIVSVILKISLAVFVYLVLACSTLIVSVIIFSYDTFRRDEVQLENKNIPNLAHQSVQSEEIV